MARNNMNKTHRLGDRLPHRIAILRALQLGDLLCAVPAFRALRAALPRAEIVLVGLPWARTFVDRFSCYLDGFAEFPGFPGLPERAPDLERIPSFLRRVQAEHFDLALQMQGNGYIANPLTVLFGARLNAGFFTAGQYCPDPERFLEYPEGIPEVMRHLSLMEFLGVPARGTEQEFPVRDEDCQALRKIDEARALKPGEYICIHPGARMPERRWPPENFAAVADSLAGHGLQVVLTGTADEASLTQAVARAMKSKAIDLAGRTNLGALAALLSGARLLVSNDTGISHLAAALRVPSVIVFTVSDPARWAPLDLDLHRILRRDAGVTSRQVLAEAKSLLEKEATYVV